MLQWVFVTCAHSNAAAVLRLNYLEGFPDLFCFLFHTSHLFLFSPQVQPRALPSPATQSPPPSRPARARGATSAPSATRTWWTRSSTPADTCVSATPVASSSRRWPTRAAPSAGGQSKISSRPTGARKLGSAREVVKAIKDFVKMDTAQVKAPLVCVCNLAQVLYSRTPSLKHFFSVMSHAHRWKAHVGSYHRKRTIRKYSLINGNKTCTGVICITPWPTIVHWLWFVCLLSRKSNLRGNLSLFLFWWLEHCCSLVFRRGKIVQCCERNRGKTNLWFH